MVLKRVRKTPVPNAHRLEARAAALGREARARRGVALRRDASCERKAVLLPLVVSRKSRLGATGALARRQPDAARQAVFPQAGARGPSGQWGGPMQRVTNRGSTAGERPSPTRTDRLWRIRFPLHDLPLGAPG